MTDEQKGRVKARLAAAARAAAIGARKALPPVSRDMAGLGGVILIARGVWEIYAPAGMIAAGVLLLAYAYLTAPRTKASS